MRVGDEERGGGMIVAGLMSGTSCDGIDVAVAELQFDGPGITLRPLADAEVAMPVALQHTLRRVMAGEAFPALTFCQLDTQIGQAFAAALVQTCNDSPGLTLQAIDLVCSHGQTLWHWEEQGSTRGTLQMGNPAWIAERTGIAVVSDLRMRDVAAGGNGAPLVGLVDAMLAAGLQPAGGLAGSPQPQPVATAGTPVDSGDADRQRLSAGCSEATGFLNLGGIANITVVRRAADDAPAAVQAYDIGPANALIDLAVARYTQGRQHYDVDGRMAASGVVDPTLLAELLAHPYYRLPPPRSTGKETFGPAYLDSVMRQADARRPGGTALEDVDTVATLTAHAAQLVINEVAAAGLQQLIISGGGAANPTLRQALSAGLAGTTVLDIDDIGLPGGAKEAYAFAVLGFLSAHGLPGTLPAASGAGTGAVLGNLTPGAAPDRLPARFARWRSGQAAGGSAAGQPPPAAGDEWPAGISRDGLLPLRILSRDRAG